MSTKKSAVKKRGAELTKQGLMGAIARREKSARKVCEQMWDATRPGKDKKAVFENWTWEVRPPQSLTEFVSRLLSDTCRTHHISLPKSTWLQRFDAFRRCKLNSIAIPEDKFPWHKINSVFRTVSRVSDCGVAPEGETIEVTVLTNRRNDPNCPETRTCHYPKGGWDQIKERMFDETVPARRLVREVERLAGPKVEGAIRAQRDAKRNRADDNDEVNEQQRNDLSLTKPFAKAARLFWQMYDVYRGLIGHDDGGRKSLALRNVSMAVTEHMEALTGLIGKIEKRLSAAGRASGTPESPQEEAPTVIAFPVPVPSLDDADNFEEVEIDEAQAV